MIQGENRAYGQRVDFEVDFKQRVAEPAPDVRGVLLEHITIWKKNMAYALARNSISFLTYGTNKIL